MNTLIGFLLFGTVEVFILLMFYKVVGGMKEIEYWHGLILCPILLILNIFQFPFVKQTTSMMLFLIYMMVVSDKTLWYKVKIIVVSFLYLLVVETVVCVFIDLFTNFNMNTDDLFWKFVYTLPMRISEIVILTLYSKRRNRRMGWFWYGEVEEVKEEKETEDEE